MELTDKDKTKKPYESPELVTYGDIRMITQTNDNSGMDDGGMGSTDKT